MEQIKGKVKDFLKKRGMDHEDIDIDQNCKVFLEEMQKGLAGQSGSLAMLPTYIETERDVPRDKPVIVMDAGGTNFRVATIRFQQDGKPAIEDFELYPMPGMKKEVGKEEFFNTMASYIDKVVDRSSSIGFCFSYPIEMFPNKDGRVTHFSKEIQASEVIGQMIGDNLNLAIGASGKVSPKQIVLLNDTVATLLAGRADFSGRTFGSYIGFILGTGTNCSYVEQNPNITKAKDLDPAKSQIVNVESGGFARAPQGTIDEKFDKSSLSPGTYTFEKMISGAYLGPLCLKTIQVAAEDGLFSDASAKKLEKLNQISTKEVSEFMYSPRAGANPLSSAVRGASEEDTVTLYYILDRLVERAAKLTAINLSSVSIKSGKGQDPSRPVCIVAEGTTFYHLKSLKQRVEYYLKQYLEDAKGIYYEIVSVENATLIGAAIAGLTN
jgi:hexokinase